MRFLAHLLIFSVICSVLSGMWFSSGFSDADAPTSFLTPTSSRKMEFRFPIDAIDPTPLSNPKGATSPGFRGDNQLIIYTPAFGVTTRTSAFGSEAVVESTIVQKMGGHDSSIPLGGFVISAHGSAVQWVQKFLKPGAMVWLDPDQRYLRVKTTPAVLLYDVDSALKQAESKINTLPRQQAQEELSQAKNCRSDLAALPNEEVSSEMTALAELCRKKAHLAYYHAIESKPNLFRGAWVRPNSVNPDEIQQTIAAIKETHITDIFLETYYQGKTIYLSEVMRQYGLPEQHPQYRGKDALELWLDAAHAQGLKVHVWTQVFFAGNERENSEQYGPILQKYPQWRNT